MSLPPLVEGPRRLWFAALVATGFVQAGAAALGARVSGDAIGGTISGIALSPQQMLALLATAAIAGGAGFAERYVGERLAQAYVLDLRLRLFSASMAAAGSIEESRLLIPFVGDLTAVRNWAARGPAAMLTASAAALAASALLIAQSPILAPGLAPLLLALFFLAALYHRLCQLIAEQRRVRSRLTRFVMRRLRRAAHLMQPESPGPDPADVERLARRAERLAAVSVSCARIVGLMNGCALFAGGLSLLAILGLAAALGATTAAVIAAIGLAGFVSTRLLDIARALQALAGGTVALDNLEVRLRDPAATP